MLSKEHFLYQKVSLLSCQELFINCKTFYSWIAPFSEALPRWPPEILFILEKPDILDCSHPTDGQLFTQGGGMWRSFCSHTSPPSVRKYWIAICKFSTLGTTFFPHVVGYFGVGRRSTGRSMESFRIHLGAHFLRRHATLLWTRSIALRNIKRLQRLWIAISLPLKWKYL